MVDLYDERYEYRRSIFLKFPGWESHYRIHQMGLFMDKGFLYQIEKDQDENPIIVKYKL